jgi:hypothetical protein
LILSETLFRLLIPPIAKWKKFIKHFGRLSSTLFITLAISGPTYTHSGLLLPVVKIPYTKGAGYAV